MLRVVDNDHCQNAMTTSGTELNVLKETRNTLERRDRSCYSDIYDLPHVTFIGFHPWPLFSICMSPAHLNVTIQDNVKERAGSRQVVVENVALHRDVRWFIDVDRAVSVVSDRWLTAFKLELVRRRVSLEAYFTGVRDIFSRESELLVEPSLSGRWKNAKACQAQANEKGKGKKKEMVVLIDERFPEGIEIGDGSRARGGCGRARRPNCSPDTVAGPGRVNINALRINSLIKVTHSHSALWRRPCEKPAGVDPVAKLFVPLARPSLKSPDRNELPGRIPLVNVLPPPDSRRIANFQCIIYVTSPGNKSRFPRFSRVRLTSDPGKD
ncbi:hypothetical protein EVAR_31311_1 [Eumeta japonica]|uniref:Uncharacterized protein n=1 Tax=Eumeta variegata TaxID=151549 RepID=A0A4C1VPX9_EUMVA|nr:hypothetical protein EVAR_31311_1 [Eumeta japonica]